jgi:putative PIN family toxin of toxin-antitoxin system
VSAPARVVFDCNVLLQALISQRGPAGGAVQAVLEGRTLLFLSDYLLAELRDVAARPHLVEKFALSEQKVAKFVETIEGCAQKLFDIPHVFDCPRDPKILITSTSLWRRVPNSS